MNAMSEIDQRFESAQQIAHKAAQTALHHFTNRDSLNIESKGTQDWVSNADRDVETEIRAALSAAFPEDSIIGEEHENVVGGSPYTWVVDPIDGTTSFVNAMPGWCVVIACLRNNETVIGVIVDPIAKETFSACLGRAATLNGEPMQVSNASSIKDGSVAVGHSGRIAPEPTIDILSKLVLAGGIYYRIGSGALMLAYVASGRLLGYVETHMYAWDCVAALFIIEQSGGQVREFDVPAMLNAGGPVLTAAPGVYDQICQLQEQA